MINLTVKASPALAALTVGSATWINEPGPSSNLCVEHRIFEDVWGTFKGFRKWTPIAGWFTMENPSMDDIGVPPISGNHHITIITVSNSLTYIKSGPPPMGTQALCDLPMADAGMMEYINDSIGGPQKDRHVMKCYDMLLPTIWMMAYFSILFGLLHFTRKLLWLRSQHIVPPPPSPWIAGLSTTPSTGAAGISGCSCLQLLQQGSSAFHGRWPMCDLLVQSGTCAC